VLTRQEKKKLVIDLYNQGKTIRDIAKELRMSFRDIGAILRKASGEDEEIQDEKHSLSPSTKAYHLFSKSRTPLQVAIALDLTESETAKYYEEYLDLKQMHDLKVVHEELGGDIGDFLKLYRLSKAARMSPEHVVKLLQIANEYLPVLEMKYKRLTKEIDSLEFEKQKLGALGNKVKGLTDVSLLRLRIQLNVLNSLISSGIFRINSQRQRSKVNRDANIHNLNLNTHLEKYTLPLFRKIINHMKNTYQLSDPIENSEFKIFEKT
jgi:hypothetical protein